MEICKLCVSIPGKSLKIDMPRPDAEVWFTTLVDALLNTQPEPDQEPDENTQEESEYEDSENLVEEDNSEEAEGPEDAQDAAPPKKIGDRSQGDPLAAGTCTG